MAEKINFETTLKNDMEAVKKYIKTAKTDKALKSELESASQQLETFNQYKMPVPKELTEKIADLKSKVKSVELTQNQKALLKYYRLVTGETVSGGTKTRTTGNIQITTNKGEVKQYKTFKELCDDYGLEVGGDSAKRVILKRHNETDIRAITQGGNVILSEVDRA